MKLLKDSVAVNCRYGDLLVKAFGPDSELIWECSEENWQGEVNILIRLADEEDKFVFYSYYYGSCAGCDEWESRQLSDEKIIFEMIGESINFNSRDELEKYLKIGDHKLDHTNRFRFLRHMRNAYLKWKNGEEYKRSFRDCTTDLED